MIFNKILHRGVFALEHALEKKFKNNIFSNDNRKFEKRKNKNSGRS